MLTKRIISCLDIKDGRTVKGVNFENIKDAGDPVELAVAYAQQGVDELVFLDITSTKCSIVPAPPLAIIGTLTDSEIAFVISIAKPFFVPSLFMDVNNISPAPSVTAFFAQSIVFVSVLNLPPFK